MSNTSFTAKNYALIDLHLHLDGSLPLHTVRQLASMQGGGFPPSWTGDSPMHTDDPVMMRNALNKVDYSGGLGKLLRCLTNLFSEGL